ncbi:hypothetical protein WHR41_07940 [Cladosporium halotolerans]|uniref:Uncharacterized protein n=1 Tax=Cladosporium halotolerans TaxID=1052096 RepID=A0AB34KGC8_9PEZI
MPAFRISVRLLSLVAAISTLAASDSTPSDAPDSLATPSTSVTSALPGPGPSGLSIMVVTVTPVFVTITATPVAPAPPSDSVLSEPFVKTVTNVKQGPVTPVWLDPTAEVYPPGPYDEVKTVTRSVLHDPSVNISQEYPQPEPTTTAEPRVQIIGPIRPTWKCWHHYIGIYSAYHLEGSNWGVSGTTIQMTLRNMSYDSMDNWRYTEHPNQTGGTNFTCSFNMLLGSQRRVNKALDGLLMGKKDKKVKCPWNKHY